MKSLLTLSMLLFSNLSSALPAVGNPDSWVLTTSSQRMLLKKDRCAQVALEAAASLISLEIQDAGVDYPDHIRLSDLHVSSLGKYYAITFEGDSTLLVQTRRSETSCKALKPSRLKTEL